METERLILDRIRETDRADYFRNISHDKRVLETFVCRYAETEEELDISPYITNEKMFAIRLKETGKLIGIILYFDDDGFSCEIGYGIGSDYWNRGYVTEAVKRFIDYCLDEKGFTTVYASYFTGNEASRRVMEKCGMTYCRFSEKEFTYLEKERDLHYYAISRAGSFTVKTNALSADTFLELYSSAGWEPPGKEQVETALSHSVATFTAFGGERPVGMARLIGDLGMSFYVKDFAVLPEYRSRGVGRLLMRVLEDFILHSIPEGNAVSLELISTKEAVGFYKSRGFEERPCEYDGPGMFKMLRRLKEGAE
jgi:ribosomal-protein-alanine N-acetyltransferase